MVPEFYVLYNGPDDLPDESIIRLSDCFAVNPPINSAEIVVKVLNVGYNEDKEILKKSRTLYEYSRFVQIIKETLPNYDDKAEAAKAAVHQALQEGMEIKKIAEITGLDEITIEQI